MAIGVIIGIAAAATAAAAGKAVKTVKESGGDINIGNNQFIFNLPGSRNSDSDEKKADLSAASSGAGSELQRIVCVYCDGMIVLENGRIKCPHCSAPIRRIPPRREVIKQKIIEPAMNISGYYVDCYNCNTKVRYTKTDIYRSPSANRIVKARGFRGHTGEVKCPRCGSFLPHFESNWRD